MVKTIPARGIKSPNSCILAENVIRHSAGPDEEVIFLVSPGAEEGMDKVAAKFGYTLETGKNGDDIEVRMSPREIVMQEVDVTGDTCPGPAITVGNILDSLQTGERLKVKCSSKSTLEDIARAVTAKGSRVIEKGEKGEQSYLIAEKAEVSASEDKTVLSGSRKSVVIVQSNGISNAERAYATFLFSKVALSMGKTVTIFLLMDGASMARQGAAAGVKHPAFDRLDSLMDEVIKAGAKIYVCELSAQFRGINETNLVSGMTIAGAATYIDLISNPANAVVNF
ncbi:putative peroxiredoxin/TusA-related sulfurtransferase [Methanomicrobium sp. W14]|jgi:predicted peroxiredoxin/TusA-related sulfurtransferase|uniref:DsrE family protein n=1 Tax=Methanomicrobium sp. W14 TaxID=2817839 RepID=UPI001AE1092C|nr:DsrE family protein [Methanomicrobium sp. W14]MBP2133699.1 putative peroxiredoxin/TusA-related sulfurtransferase [Methanomicrobium sp. W14]